MNGAALQRHRYKCLALRFYFFGITLRLPAATQSARRSSSVTGWGGGAGQSARCALSSACPMKLWLQCGHMTCFSGLPVAFVRRMPQRIKPATRKISLSGTSWPQESFTRTQSIKTAPVFNPRRKKKFPANGSRSHLAMFFDPLTPEEGAGVAPPNSSCPSYA